MAIFICLAIICSAADVGLCTKPAKVYKPPTAIEIEKIINVNVGPASTGIALSIGPAGKLFIAISSPPQILSLDSNQDQSYVNVNFVSDFCILTGFTLVYTDNSSPLLFRTDSRLRELSSFQLDYLNGDIANFQPISITSSPNGQIYFTNGYDNEIWMIDQNGSVFRYSGLNNAIRLGAGTIEFDSINNSIVVLDGNNLEFLNSYGKYMDAATYETSLDNASDMIVSGSEIWIGGDRIECYSTITRKAIFNVNNDELISLGLPYISAIALDGDSKLYLLSANGDKLAKTTIVRESSEK